MLLPDCAKERRVHTARWPMDNDRALDAAASGWPWVQETRAPPGDHNLAGNQLPNALPLNPTRKNRLNRDYLNYQD